MSDAAEQLFDSLDSYNSLDELIAAGEAEGPHLECKAPSAPLLSKDLQSGLARALSGFSNTAGGVIIWGMSTTKHPHDNSDVLTQIVPIGKCTQLERQIKNKILALATPPVLSAQSKILRESPKDTRGVIVSHIPKTGGDPVQAQDGMFYFRSGDEFVRAPYDMIKRLFAATESPDLTLFFGDDPVKRNDDGSWEIPIVVTNRASAVAEHGRVFVNVNNFSSCESINPTRQLRDVSELNPGKKIFSHSIDRVVHRELNQVCGYLTVKMKGRKRRLDLEIRLFANKMRARALTYSFVLSGSKIPVKNLKEKYLY